MPTPGPTDTELALLAPGEHVLNKEAVNIAGRETLDNLNAQGLKVRETMNQTKNSLQNVSGLTVNPVSSPSSAPMTGIPQANAAASTMPKLPQIPGMTKQSQGAQSSGNPLYGDAMKNTLFPKSTYPGQDPMKVPVLQGFEDGGAIPMDQVQTFEDGGSVIQQTDPTLAQRLKASGQNSATQSAQLRYDIGKQGKSYLQPPTAPSVNTAVNVGTRSDYRFNPLPGASALAPTAVDSDTVGNVASDIAGAYKGPFAEKVKAFFPRPSNTPVPGSFADKAMTFFQGGIQGYEDGTPFDEDEIGRYAKSIAESKDAALKASAKSAVPLSNADELENYAKNIAESKDAVLKANASKVTATPEASKAGQLTSRVDPWTGKAPGGFQISQRIKDFFNPKLMGKQLAEAAKDPVTAGLAAHAVNEQLLDRELSSGKVNPLLAGGRMVLDAAGNPLKYTGKRVPNGDNSPLGALIEAATPVPELAEAGYFGKPVPPELATENQEPTGVTQKAIEQSQTATPDQDVPLNILGQPVQKLTESGGYMVGTGPNAVEEIPWSADDDSALRRTLTADEYNELRKKKAAYKAQVESSIVPESETSSEQFDAKGHYLGGTSESKRGGAQPYPEHFEAGQPNTALATRQAEFIQQERQKIINEQTERAKQEQLARIYELMLDPNEEKRKSGKKFLKEYFPEISNRQDEKNIL